MQPNPTVHQPAGQLERTESYLVSDPANPHLLATAIDLALAAGLTDRAVAHAEAAVRHRPDDDYLLARLANVRLAQRRWVDAAALFDRLLERHVDSALAYGAAYARYAQGQHPEALKVLRAHAGTSPLPCSAVTLLVRLQHQTGAADEALATALRERERCGNDPALLAVASLAALDADQAAHAQTLAEQSLAGPRRYPEALVTAASLAIGRRDEATAQTLLDEVIADRPEEGRAWSALGLVSMLRRDLSTARKQLETAVRFMPGHIGTWHSLGWCCLFTQDIEGARAAFSTALQLDRNFAESHGGIAVVHAMAGESALAQASIERAQRLDPQGLSARYAQMVLQGDTQDATRFKAVAARVLQGRQSPSGVDLAMLLDLHQTR